MEEPINDYDVYTKNKITTDTYNKYKKNKITAYTYDKCKKISKWSKDYQDKSLALSVKKRDELLTFIWDGLVFVTKEILPNRITTGAISGCMESIELYADTYASYIVGKMLTDDFYFVRDSAFHYIKKSLKICTLDCMRDNKGEYLDFFSYMDGKEDFEGNYHHLYDDRVNDDPQNIILRKSIVEDTLEHIINILPNDDIPLFISCCLNSDVDINRVVLPPLKRVQFKVCKHLLIAKLHIFDDDRFLALSKSPLATLILISDLCKDDPRLMYLPMVIGEVAFIKLLRYFEGENLRIPNKRALDSAYNNAAKVAYRFNTKFKIDTGQLDMIFHCFKVLEACPLNEKVLFDTKDKDKLILNQELVTSYFRSVFTKVDKVSQILLKQIENSTIEDSENLIQTYPKIIEDIKTQIELLDKLSELIDNLRKVD